MVIRIVTPSFSAEIDYPNTYPPSLEYMRGWLLKQILAYCWDKGWECRIIPDDKGALR